MPEYTPEQLTELRRQLTVGYDTPTRQDAFGADWNKAEAVIHTGTSSLFASLVDEVGASVARTARTVDEHIGRLGAAAYDAEEAANRYGHLRFAADNQVQKASLALQAARNFMYGGASANDLVAALNRSVESAPDLARRNELARSAAQTLEGRLAAINEALTFDLAQRDRALVATTEMINGIERPTALAEIRSALGAMSAGSDELRQELARAGKSDLALQFTNLRNAAEQTSRTIDAAVSNASTVLRDEPVAVPTSNSEKLIDGQLANVNALADAVRLAAEQIVRSGRSGRPIEQSTVMELEMELTAFLGTQQTLAVHAGRMEQDMAQGRQQIVWTTRELQRAADEIATDVRRLNNLPDNQWRSVVTTAVHLTNALGEMAAVEDNGRGALYEAEKVIESHVEESIATGDLATVRRVGVQAVPTDPTDRAAVIGAAVKAESFAVAYGDAALSSLLRGGRPSDGPQAAHGEAVMTAIEAVPSQVLSTSQTVSRSL